MREKQSSRAINLLVLLGKTLVCRSLFRILCERNRSPRIKSRIGRGVCAFQIVSKEKKKTQSRNPTGKDKSREGFKEKGMNNLKDSAKTFVRSDVVITKKKKTFYVVKTLLL